MTPGIPAYSEALSPSPQQAAVLDFVRRGSGHGVIRATAGAGKTSTLVQVARLLPTDGRVLFLAFARDAARELRQRLPGHVEARTVHSLGRSTLLREVRRRGGRAGPPDGGKYLALARDLLQRFAFRLSREAREEAAGYLAAIAGLVRLTLTDASDPAAVVSLAERSRLVPPEDPQLSEALVAALPEVLERGSLLALEGSYDFTDMLYAPHVHGLSPPPFDFACIDEAQDYSALALEFTIGLAAAGGRLLFVGDPRQGIFGFAGADPQAMSRIERRTDATVLPLSVTYRCPRRHVELARAFAPEIEAAPGAASGSVRSLPEELLPSLAHPGDLVLCRANAPLVTACLRLAQAGLAATVRGHDLALRLRRLAEEALGAGRGPPQALLARYLKRARSRLSGRPGAEARLTALQDELSCLEALLDGLGRPKVLERLLTRIDETFAEASRGVSLTTIHRAKGREADRVLLLAPELLPAPHARTADEIRGEACVIFVALTRAREELVILEPDPPPPPAPPPSPPVGDDPAVARERLEEAWAWVRAAAAAGRPLQGTVRSGQERQSPTPPRGKMGPQEAP